MFIHSFVTATNDHEVLQANLQRSPIVVDNFNLCVINDPDNLPRHYNELLDRVTAETDDMDALVVFAHHDVYLPADWGDEVLEQLTRLPTDWAVAGVAGIKTAGSRGQVYKTPYGWLCDRGREWGSPYLLPREVDTLDECLLIVRADLGLRFDERFAFDFYGADICLQAQALGRRCFAIRAWCEHNSSRQIGGRTPAFYEAEEAFREKWKNKLPVATTCAIIK